MKFLKENQNFAGVPQGATLSRTHTAQQIYQTQQKSDIFRHADDTAIDTLSVNRNLGARRLKTTEKIVNWANK